MYFWATHIWEVPSAAALSASAFSCTTHTHTDWLSSGRYEQAAGEPGVRHCSSFMRGALCVQMLLV